MQRSLLLAAVAILSNTAAAQLPPPPVPPENPITPEKAVLGKILFWEEQLSSDNTVACGTCHIPTAGGGDPRTGPPNAHPGPDGIVPSPDDVFGSPGVSRADAEDEYRPDGFFAFEPQVTRRQANSVIGAAYHDELFWDGRASSTFVEPQGGALSIVAGGALESQAVAPPVSDVEMAHEARDWSAITAKLAGATPLRLASSLPPDVATALALAPTYPALFAAAFGDGAITAERIAYAIATYERTLVPDQTPWDEFQAGNPAALTPQQTLGLNLFTGQGRCDLCHVPPRFTDDAFHTLGVRPPFEDTGRQEVTGNPADLGRFKTPSLRNVGLRPRFFHTGGFPNLSPLVAFYNGGGGNPINRDPLLIPLGLNLQQRNAIVAFLAGGLTDPRVANELPPFDRPTLFSETALPAPPVVGRAVAGSGGFTPRMIATSPSAAGVEGFRLGLASGLGGALAFLDVAFVAGGGPTPTFPATASSSAGGAGPGSSASAASPTRHRLHDYRLVVRLAGDGAGAGFGTYHLEIPATLQASGLSIEAQWFVLDPAAPEGLSRSERVALTIL
jgi:cytochrome c peroxidase